MATRSWLITSPSAHTLPARPRLRVQLVGGAVSVEGHDGEDVAVEVAAVAGNPLEVVVDDTLVSIGYAAIGWEGWVKRLTAFRSGDAAQVTIRVPRGTQLSVATAAARTSLTDVSADCSLASASGSVYAARVSGRVSARTFSGAITLDEHDGPATIHTASGAVAVQGTVPHLSISTGSGRVRLRNTAGNSVVSVTTLSGDIEASLAAAGLVLTARTVSGAVDVDGVSRRTSSGPAVVSLDEREQPAVCWLTTNTVSGALRVQRAGSDSM